jgi:hypothetical protein
VKTVAVVSVCLFAVAAVAVVLFYCHTMVLERNRTAEFRVEEVHGNGPLVVRISGFCGHSAMSVKNITSRRADTSIVVLVHIFFVRSGTTGNFQYDVPVPDGVNEIRFGKEQVVIWHRATHP